MVILHLTEVEFCEDVDRHPHVPAVIYGVDDGAYWCQECIDELVGTDDEITDYIIIKQPGD